MLGTAVFDDLPAGHRLKEKTGVAIQRGANHKFYGMMGQEKSSFTKMPRNCTIRLTVSEGIAKPTPAKAPDGLAIMVLTPQKSWLLRRTGLMRTSGMLVACMTWENDGTCYCYEG